MYSNLFSRPDSIFVVCFSIQNFDMPGDEISRLINVIFNGDNFVQWSQAMRSYFKGRKLWLYVSGDRPIPEQVDKETNSAYAIRIEDWESANHQIITWFRNTSISSTVDEFGNIDIAKEVWDLLVTRYARPIMRRLLLMWLDFLLSGLLLSFLRLANGHSFRWMSKMFFLMVNSQRKSI